MYAFFKSFTVPVIGKSFKSIGYYDREGYVFIDRDLTEDGYSSGINYFHLFNRYMRVSYI